MQGFAAAFLAAGARGVIATLWKVDDMVTALLMSEALERTAAGRPPRAALAEAQNVVRTMSRDEAASRLTVLAEAASAVRPIDPADGREPPARLDHPKYWAPFVLFGR